MLFETDADRQRQERVRSFLAERWNVELREIADRSPIDWFAVRRGDIVAVLEFKARTTTSDAFPTVFLAWRKWDALMRASLAFDVPGFYVVAFADDVLAWINVCDVAPKSLRMRGRRDRGVPNDVEPMVLIDIVTMKTCRISDAPAPWNGA